MGKCLTCKYEPDWGSPIGVEYPRSTGKCKYKVDWPDLPYVARVHIASITKYSDNSGIPTSCKTWKKKH